MKRASLLAGLVGPVALTCLSLVAGLTACSSEQPRANPRPQAPIEQVQSPGMAPPQAQTVAVQQQSGQPSPNTYAAIVPAAGVPPTNLQPGAQGNLGLVDTSKGSAQVPTERIVIQTQNIPTVTETRVGADINRMSEADFKALGLTQEESEAIVRYRTTHGAFHSVGDLTKVPNMDTVWLAQNQQRLAAVSPVPTG